jgi:hypothetical protein
MPTQPVPRTAEHGLQPDAAACLQRALRWLQRTGIRCPDGAYRSIYEQRSRRYTCWYDNKTCLNATTGAVLALLEVGERDLAAQSANHICELAIPLSATHYGGAIRSGRGSALIFANWIMSATGALMRVYDATGHSRYLEVAESAGRFVRDTMQASDGSIRQTAVLGSFGARVRDRHFRPRQVWLANAVEGFLALADRTGDDEFTHAADRFIGWLAGQQRRDGAFAAHHHTFRSRLATAVHTRKPRELVTPCAETHPTAITRAIRALAATGHMPEATRAVAWAADALGPNGLFYERYALDGEHSVSEDVMPTALLGLTLLDYPELCVRPDLLCSIKRGISYAQIGSTDPQADGGIRGLPRHPTSGEDAYCWDTTFAIQFLHRLCQGDEPCDQH